MPEDLRHSRNRLVRQLYNRWRGDGLADAEDIVHEAYVGALAAGKTITPGYWWFRCRSKAKDAGEKYRSRANAIACAGLGVERASTEDEIDEQDELRLAAFETAGLGHSPKNPEDALFDKANAELRAALAAEVQNRIAALPDRDAWLIRMHAIDEIGFADMIEPFKEAGFKRPPTTVKGMRAAYWRARDIVASSFDEDWSL